MPVQSEIGISSSYEITQGGLKRVTSRALRKSLGKSVRPQSPLTSMTTFPL